MRLLTMASIALLSSCTIEDIDEPDEKTGVSNGSGEFLLELPASDTRSVGSSAENLIGNITILVFDKTTKALVSKIPGTALTPSGTNNNTWGFKGQMPMGSYDLMALANASDLLTSITSGTRDDIAASLVRQSNAKWNTATSIPMWGELKDQTLPSGPTITFKMMRMLAKINVLIDNSVANFSMTKLYYYNYNTKGYPVPQAANYTADGVGNITINAPSTYGDPGKQSGGYLDYSTEITGQRSCMDKMYVFEAARVDQFLTPPADWSAGTQWQGNPCLVIGGRYGGATTDTYYRVDFIEKTAGGDLWHSLLRNHAYQVVVTSVGGSGYSSAQIALESQPLNMDIATYVADESDMSAITMDGAYRMAISRSDVIIARSVAPSGFALRLKTNYPGGWSAARYIDAACTVPMTASTTPSTSWMTVGTTSGGSTTGTDIQVTLTTNTVGSGYIKFTSGRMTLVVKVSCSIAPDFARSNIVQVGSTLTFAVTEAESMTYPANSQGLNFRFGSLIGINSTGAHRTAFASSQVTFLPVGGPASRTWTWLYSGTNDATNDIPYTSANDDTQIQDYFAYLYGTTRYRLSEGRGDICSFISDQSGWVSEGKWRMPTRAELTMLWNETQVREYFGPSATDWQAGIRYGGSSPITIGATPGYGRGEVNSGVFMGAGINSGPLSSYDIKMPPRGVLFIPAGGYRSGPGPEGGGTAYAKGNFIDPGIQAVLWSSTTEPRTSAQNSTATRKAFCINTYGGGTVWQEGKFVRGDAMPVRCLRIE